MDHESTPERLAGTLQHLSRHWESRRRPGGASGRRALTIAVSREAGTQGTAIAREAGRLLGWHVYDHELLECIAKDMGLRTHLLESVDERNHSWILETTEAFLSAPLKSDWGPLVTESGFVHHLVKIVLAAQASTLEKYVIVGRSANIHPAAGNDLARSPGGAGARSHCDPAQESRHSRARGGPPGPDPGPRANRFRPGPFLQESRRSTQLRPRP